jgi:hypothetical protein
MSAKGKGKADDDNVLVFSAAGNVIPVIQVSYIIEQAE